MLSTTHRQYVLALYKNLLSEAGVFFDDRARLTEWCRVRMFMIRRVKSRFRQCQKLNDIDRIKNKITEGRKYLHGIERANNNDQKCAMRILRAAYGRTGKVRHYLLMPYIDTNPSPDYKPPEPFYAHIPHTAPPPPLCAPLQTLIKGLQNKKLEPELPESRYKPLHLGRKANLLWGWRSKLISKVQVPLPMEILNELELKATSPIVSIHQTMDGGPSWESMYGTRQRRYLSEESDNYVHLSHLDPNSRLIPRRKLRRSQSLQSSPYSSQISTKSPFSVTSMLDLVTESSETSNVIRAVHSIKPRQLRRYYQRLLAEVPCMTGLTTQKALWEAGLRNILFTSTAASQSTQRLLMGDEMPSPEVIEKALSKGKKSKASKS
ncbi:hypothetical protein INT43_004163 [Umbelopsis isabellina]|uniref:LYR motif-containing protein Cup1-like N-terminal domain-containing protein n=1 Tax=Mortierella isabellina TaxID=91625 RepID=A0A8H7UBT3_MORIS|nr:hypothetical protein INT43_004163 [Umbelopsis isabellina]